ncbi:MAG: glycoside hydrolase family 16 protein [Xanthomonadales bacterium]|nr:glycoside hydrolase family 16 protein [Xanthomonadales bacterium]
MNNLKVLHGLSAALILGFTVAFATPAQAQCVGFEYCTLVWSDEFDGTEVDETKWSFQRGDGSEVGLPSGWGNNEQQWYTDQNATVAGGFLTITAREESVEPGFNFTSARLRTFRKGDWTYGRMEMRAKMPLGKGLWPAFWMLPTDNVYGGWAASGEIDIVEYLGDDPEEILGTIHYGGEWPNNTFSGQEYRLDSGSFHDDFHEFAIEWEEGEIRWYVDDVLYSTKTNWTSNGGAFPAPFDKRFHLLLNMAVGGNLPGAPDANTLFPQELVVDYVRVYQEADPPAFLINAGLNDAWFNPLTNGQGFFVNVFPDTGIVFVGWFTYDVERPPEDVTAILGEPGHRWLSAQGPFTGDTATMDVYLSSGGVFDAENPPVGTPENIGTMTITWTDCNTAQVSYDLPGLGLSGTIPIQRIVLDNIALCEALSTN